jgi:hypothetical protein
MNILNILLPPNRANGYGFAISHIKAKWLCHIGTEKSLLAYVIGSITIPGLGAQYYQLYQPNPNRILKLSNIVIVIKQALKHPAARPALVLRQSALKPAILSIALADYRFKDAPKLMNNNDLFDQPAIIEQLIADSRINPFENDAIEEAICKGYFTVLPILLRTNAKLTLKQATKLLDIALVQTSIVCSRLRILDTLFTNHHFMIWLPQINVLMWAVSRNDISLVKAVLYTTNGISRTFITQAMLAEVYVYARRENYSDIIKLLDQWCK